MTKDDLIRFEKEVADRFERGEIRGPIHLSGGNEDQLIEIFKDIKPTDWVFSTWRSHYHALLHGVPEQLVMDEIMAGRSMNLIFPEYKFFTSAIVGGILPIAVGVAYAMKQKCIPWRIWTEEKVWCFVGDMTATTGICREAITYASGHNLPLRVISENNEFSTNSPTRESWGTQGAGIIEAYYYERTFPHCGIGKWVNF